MEIITGTKKEKIVLFIENKNKKIVNTGQTGRLKKKKGSDKAFKSIITTFEQMKKPNGHFFDGYLTYNDLVLMLLKVGLGVEIKEELPYRPNYIPRPVGKFIVTI